MNNPMFNAPMNNPMLNMINQFKQFKKTFTGDAKSTVMQMVQSGQISQEQLNMAQNMAKQFQGILK